MHGWINAWMDGWVDGWSDVWVNGWVDGWMDVWIDGSMDRSMYSELKSVYPSCVCSYSALLTGASNVACLKWPRRNRETKTLCYSIGDSEMAPPFAFILNA